MYHPTLYIMVGTSGSGKSTVAKYIARTKGAVIVSPDQWRKKLTGDINNQESNAKVYEVAYDEMVGTLSAGYDVVFDATNTTTKARKLLLDAVTTECKIVFVYVRTTLETAFNRVKSRTNGQVVPEAVVRRQYKQLMASLEELLNNNFTTIVVKNDRELDEEVLDKMRFFQYNVSKKDKERG